MQRSFIFNMNIPHLYRYFIQHPKIITDSRKAVPGSLFFALKGKNFDGNQFAQQAIDKGCDYAIIDSPLQPANDRFILVKNSLETLQKLATYHRALTNVQVIGITGTNGKTTTKELIAAVLSKKYKIHCTTGNLNNHIGVPLSLLGIKKDVEIAIIEMGANHPGEIRDLCSIALPDFGIITNVGKAHLEGFGTFENIINAKSELYEFLKENDGIAFVNADNKYLMDKLISFDIEAYEYGTGINNYCIGKLLESTFYLSLRLSHSDDDGLPHEIELNTQLYGSYNFENVMAAATVGFYFNIPLPDIKNAIEAYIPRNNRSQLLKTPLNTLILDAYNANPVSMSEAIKYFNKINAENKLLILGNMLELGEASLSEHAIVIDLLVNFKFKDVILVGNLFGEIHQHYFPVYNTINELIEEVKMNPLKNKTILLKGSRGAELERIVEFL